jgi:predicted PurR-regulated permease PerM
MTPTPASRDGAQALARQRWHELSERLRTVTPQAIGRALLTLACLGLTGWVVVSSWPALLPFVAGGVIAYAVLPLANRLSTVMPRVIAALLAQVLALAVLAGVIVLVVPPLIAGVVEILLRLPTPDEVEAGLVALQAQLVQLPEPMRSIVLEVAQETFASLSAVLDGVVSGAAIFVTQQILGVAGTVSFVLGLLVIPIWIITLVKDDRAIRQRAGRLLAPSIRADVFAVARIFDRAFAAFLRIRVVLAITTGVLVYLGLSIATALEIAPFPYAVAAGTLLGVLQLVPELGFFLGFFPILLVLAIGGPVPAATVAIVYVLAVRLGGLVVEPKLGRGVLDVHPGLLIPAIVVFSEFGVLWLLAAAPVVAILRDLVRYLAGRLAEPPRPAGQLPGDRAPSRPVGVGEPDAAPIPSTYRSVTQRRPAT